MKYVLDTDHLSLLGHKNSPEAPRIRRRIAQLPPEDAVVTTVINLEEQMRGWMARLAKTQTFADQIQVYSSLLTYLDTFRGMTVLEFSQAAATIAQELRSRPVRIGTMDLKIAAIALANSATVVSRNTADFGRVPDLRVEDWSYEGQSS
jgi:tRNA(fMet)-specific endonuclease VapC